MTCLFLIGLLLVILFTASHIYIYGNTPSLIKADAAIVLGAEVWDNEPSPVFRERINHAVNLYKARDVSKLIFTGGVGAGKQISEAEAGKQYAVKNGVNELDILIETKSRTTNQNLKYAKKVGQQHNLNKFLVVSDPLHMKRAVLMARNLGLDAFPSPTPTTRYRSFKSQLQFLSRETYFYFVYLVFKA
ncbi:protein sanA-like protein [Calothrix sp. HK-06]|nr:protein sanA-like protein [Calothrix sp. HK-06]